MFSARKNTSSNQQQYGMIRKRTPSTASAVSTLSTMSMGSARPSATATSNSENIQVTVRCRPLSKKEHGNCWDIQDSMIVSKDQKLKKQHEFLFGINNH